MVYQRWQFPPAVTNTPKLRPPKVNNPRSPSQPAKPASSEQRLNKQSLGEQYDPFGIHQAVLRAQQHSTTRWHLAGSRLVNGVVLLIGLLPPVLALLSMFVVVNVSVPFWMRGLGWIFLLWVALFVIDQGFQLLANPSDDTMDPTATQPGRRGSVIVIGAGPIGLATVKECLAEGLEVQCFERQSGVGGVFRFNKKYAGGCWPTVKLTTSPWVTAYSDYPPMSSSSNHYTAQQYVDYLEGYVHHFQLSDHLHFGQMVASITPFDNGRWCVTTVDQESEERQVHHCDRVAICVGLNLNPKPINLPGQKTFTGEICHSSHYTGIEDEDFSGQRVVVVGAGESGTDIAAELSSVAKETSLSLRGGKFIIPRTNPLNGVANDYDTNRIRYSLPVPLRNWFMAFERRICFYTGNHTPESAFRAQLLKASNIGPSYQTATKADDFIPRVIDGKLNLRKNVVGFDQEYVVFSDGLRQPADRVIFAHGYSPAFPFLKYPEGLSARHPGDMFLNMFHPELGDSIAFCGFARPAIGAIPPTGELQARLFAQVAAGKRVLPSRLAMLKDIETAKQENAISFPNQPQPNAVVNWIPYMDKVARLVGCKPQPLKFWRQPHLVWRLFTGPMTGAYYRLQGSGQSEVAFKTIRMLPRMHRIREIIVYSGLHFWSWPLQVLHPHPRWRRCTTIV
ncbi:MAG: NAD(P)-binding domain-containing protein [Cyanobacteria bacterium P01_F01_bin.3]